MADETMNPTPADASGIRSNFPAWANQTFFHRLTPVVSGGAGRKADAMKPLPANYQTFLNQREIPRDATVPSLSAAQISGITQLVFAQPDPQQADMMFVFGSSGGDWPAVAELFSRGLAKKILVNGKLGRDYFVEGKPLAHRGRALRTLKKFFPRSQFFPFTCDAVYDGVAVCRESWRQQPTAKARVYGEYLRIRRYAARGDIAA